MNMAESEFANSYKARHAAAMLEPEGPHERTLVNLYKELTVVADRYKDDQFMNDAITSIGHSIIVLLNGELGRIDQAAMDKMVRDVVERSGNDSSNL
mgnify:CR=1 FL=1